MAGRKINVKIGKNKFYRTLKLDKETRRLVNFFREIKEKMLKEGDKSSKGAH